MTPSTERDLQQMVETFREKIVQCLVCGDYAKGGPYVLETLMLYIAVELFLRSDAEIGIWILLGKFSRLSIRCQAEIDYASFLFQVLLSSWQCTWATTEIRNTSRSHPSQLKCANAFGLL